MSNFYFDIIRKDPRFRYATRVSDVALLEPAMAAAVQLIIIDALGMGIRLMVYETYRSQERQRDLFASHATQLQAVGVHHYGLAADIVRNVNGEPSWKGDFTFLRDLAKTHGLISGYDWGFPDIKHSFVDACHVQRCSLRMQADLFAGNWYPDDGYDPQANT